MLRAAAIASLVLALHIGSTSVARAQPAASEPAEAALKPFLDKNGGYRDKSGGYYDPTAGTYTDREGGVVDNWGGYTYADGSYKIAGNYYDAPKRTLSLAGPEGQSIEVDTTASETRNRLRKVIADHGGFNNNLVRYAMFAKILEEHQQAIGKVR